MIIKGWQKISLINYPGKICSVVFLPGCDFRCHFCQNTELVLQSEQLETIPISEVLEFLEKKKSWVDGVCITGGEPTLQPRLLDFIQKVKETGLLVKLDTNGSRPEVIEQLLKAGLLDFIAMDIKGPLERYSEIVGVKVNLQDIKKSIDLIRNSGLDYEFRTTFVPGLIEKEDMEKIGQWLEGAKKYAIQNFRSQVTLDKKYQEVRPYSKEGIEEIAGIAKSFFKKIEVRE